MLLRILTLRFLSFPNASWKKLFSKRWKSILGTSAIILTRRIRSQIGLFPFSDYEGRLWGRDPAKISHKEHSLPLASRFNLRRIFIWQWRQGAPWSPAVMIPASLLRPTQGTEIPWAEQHSQKREREKCSQKSQEKMLNITDYWRNVNQNHTEVSITLYPSERPSVKNLRTINAREGVEKRGLSCTVGGNIKWYNHQGEQYGGSLKD